MNEQLRKCDFGGECVHRVTRAEKVHFASLERHVSLTVYKISSAIARAGVVVVLTIGFVIVNPDAQHQPHSEQKKKNTAIVSECAKHENKKHQPTEI